jgi:hypothetical protein
MQEVSCRNCSSNCPLHSLEQGYSSIVYCAIKLNSLGKYVYGKNMMDSDELEERCGRGSKNNDGKLERSRTTGRDNNPQPAPSSRSVPRVVRTGMYSYHCPPLIYVRQTGPWDAVTSMVCHTIQYWRVSAYLKRKTTFFHQNRFWWQAAYWQKWHDNRH